MTREKKTSRYCGAVAARSYAALTLKRRVRTTDDICAWNTEKEIEVKGGKNEAKNE